MNFLGAHMSVLRLAGGTGVLVHEALGLSQGDGIDLSLDLPCPLTTPVAIAGQPGVMIEPSGQPRIVHITRGHQDLWADPREAMARFRDRHEGRFEFLLIDDQELDHLRTLLRHRWAFGLDAHGPEVTIVPEHPFLLDFGKGKLDLRHHMPRRLASGLSTMFETEAGEFTVTQAGGARQEIQLCKRPRMYEPKLVSTLDALQSGEDAWLVTKGAEEIAGLPVTVCNADRDWMFKKPAVDQDHIIGRHHCRMVIARESNKYVLMSRHAEGVIFDEHGVCNEDGYLEGYGYRGGKPLIAPPEGLRCDHDRIFVGREVLADVPYVHGNTIVFALGHLTNYTHWLIDYLLALHIVLDYAPAGARVLLPGTLRALQKESHRIVDHHETLRAFGYADLPSVEMTEPYCRVEHVYWLEGEAVYNMPREYMQSFRARVLRLRPSPAKRNGRIYVARRRNRRIANTDGLDVFLERQGFITRYIEDYSIDEQIGMFSQAEWVIGPHGAELGNLLFCQPGTKVLELAPDCDFKPFYSYMSNKLDLIHGVLPCATTDGTFWGDIVLDMHKFAALFRMLKNRF